MYFYTFRQYLISADVSEQEREVELLDWAKSSGDKWMDMD